MKIVGLVAVGLLMVIAIPIDARAQPDLSIIAQACSLFERYENDRQKYNDCQVEYSRLREKDRAIPQSPEPIQIPGSGRRNTQVSPELLALLGTYSEAELGKLTSLLRENRNTMSLGEDLSNLSVDR